MNFELTKKEALKSNEFAKIVCNIKKGYSLPLKNDLSIARNKIPATQWHCNICGCRFRSIDGILEIDKVVTCGKCKAKTCKIKCASKDPEKGWMCRCCQHSESWYAGLLTAIQPNSNKNWYTTNIMVDCIDPNEIDSDLEDIQRREREQVRDFIERLVGAMLGGDLDNVSVKKLYNHAKYDALFSRYHNDLSSALTDLGSALQISIANLPISGQTPCTSHAALKQLIQRFIQEAAELPKLEGKLDDQPIQLDQTNDRTYEDLLSTAILNKVIQNYQEGVPSSSGSVSSRTSSRKKCDKEYFIGERNLDANKKYDDNSSTSSLDEWVKSDSSLGSIKYVDQSSLTIKQCIDEVPSSGDEQDDADFESIKSNDWQENWYLQKRKFKGANSPVPVPMLVPNPVVEAKVLIGDREADDTTDLSDAASDFGDEIEGPPSLNAILVDSKNIIGGKNGLENILPSIDIISDNSGLDTDTTDETNTMSIPVNNFGGRIKNNLETSNDVLINDSAIDDLAMLSMDSNTEKDTECTERYGSLPRTILKSPRPAPRHSKEIKGTDMQIDEIFENEDNLENIDSGVTSDEDDKPKVFKGSYSEREKEKWNHGVELPNNPYSKNNLERRLSETNSTNSILGRDYVIRQSSKSAGIKHKLLADNENEDLNGLSNNIEENDQTDSIPVKADVTESADSKPVEAVLFKAIPAMIQEDVSDMESSIEPQTPTRPNHLDISSDSDYSVERCYNLETGEILQKTGDVRKEIIQKTPSPKGLKFTQKDFDENHNVNNDTRTKKKQFLRSLTHDDEEEIKDILNEDRIIENNSFIVQDRKNSLEQEIAFLTPQENHFKLVRDIANETSGEYNNVPISPPAEYKTHTHPMYNKEAITNDSKRNSITDESFYKKYSIIPKPIKSNNSFENNDDFSLTHSDNIYDIRPESSLSTDSEINDLKDKQIVKNLLGEFSKSFPNLNASQKRDCSRLNSQQEFPDSGPNSIEIDEDIEDVKPIVKTTKNKHDSFKNSKESGAHVYSLTARSIPRQFRKELQKEQSPTIDPADIISSDAPAEDSDMPFPTARSKIDFFEKLKS